MKFMSNVANFFNSELENKSILDSIIDLIIFKKIVLLLYFLFSWLDN